MIFIFEDNKDDIISEFYRRAYNNNISNKFIYSNGNSFIPDISTNLLKNTNDSIVVFIDMIPGNKSIIEIYKKLHNISKANNFRLIVLPIICAEYYLIKSLYKSQVLKNTEGIDICINREFYGN